jgi:hypothetical protein
MWTNTVLTSPRNEDVDLSSDSQINVVVLAREISENKLKITKARN